MKKILIFLALLGLLAGAGAAAFADPPSLILPANAAVKLDGSYYYFPDQLNNRIRIVRASDAWPVATINLNGTPRGLAVAPNGEKLYVSVTTAQGIEIKVYNISFNNPVNTALIKAITLEANDRSHTYTVNGIAISPTGQYLYAAEESSGRVYIIRLIDDEVSHITVGGYTGLYGVAVKPDNSRLYVSSRTGNCVLVYNIAANPILQGDPIATIAGCPLATHLICKDTITKEANGSYKTVNYLFVKVNQKILPYNDCRIYDTANDSMALKSNVSIYQTYHNSPIPIVTMEVHSSDPNNDYDAMALGPDGAFLYLTHWNLAEPSAYKLFLYVYSMGDLPSASEGKWVYGMPTGSMDSLLCAPDGQSIWQGYSMAVDTYRKALNDEFDNVTGYSTVGAKVPGAPAFIAPLPGDVLDADPFVVWLKAYDADSPTLAYMLEYVSAEGVASNAWKPVDFFTIADNLYNTDAVYAVDTTVYNVFKLNTSYYLRIKAYDGADLPNKDTLKDFATQAEKDAYLAQFFKAGNFGPYAYTGPFTRSGVPDVPTHFMVAPPNVKMVTAVATWWAVDQMTGSFLGDGDTYVVSYGTNAAASNLGTVTVPARVWKWGAWGPSWKDNTDAKITSLNPGVTYKAKVKAVKDGVSSGWSNIYTFKTSTTLETPSNLMVSDVTMTTALATWWAVDGATGYDVWVEKQMQLEDPFTHQPIGPVMWLLATTESVKGANESGKEITWLKIKNLIPNKGYRVSVRATREVAANLYPGASNYSPPEYFTTTNKLGTPEGVTVSNIGMTTAQVSWESVGGATGYYVEIEHPKQGGLYDPITQEAVYGANAEGKEITWLKVKGLSPDTAYTAKVTALREVNPYPQVSDPSPRVSFKTSTVLPLPEGVMVYNIGATSAWVSWEAVGGATGYTVKYYPTAAPASTQLVTLEGGENITWTRIPSFELPALVANTDYNVEVCADRVAKPGQLLNFAPQHSGYVHAAPYPFHTGLFDGIIDDYETKLTWPASYANGQPFGTGVTLDGPVAGGGQEGSKAMKVKYSSAGDYGGWGGYFEALEIPAEYTYFQYSIKSDDGSQNEYHFELVVDNGTPKGEPYAAPEQKLINTGGQYKVQVISLSSFKKVDEQGNVIVPEVVFDNSKKIKGYNVVYKGPTPSNAYHYFDNVRVGSGAPGNLTFSLYDISGNRNDNWISAPFIGMNTLLGIAQSISVQYVPSGALTMQDRIVITKFDPLLQMTAGQITYYYDTQAASWKPQDYNTDAEGNPTTPVDFPVEVGEMLRVDLDVAGNPKSGNFMWQASGAAPANGQVTFNVIAADPATGNNCWISVPVYKPGLQKARQLGALVENAFAQGANDPVKYVQITSFDNETKTSKANFLYKENAVWLPQEGDADEINLVPGYPYIINITLVTPVPMGQKKIKTLTFQ